MDRRRFLATTAGLTALTGCVQLTPRRRGSEGTDQSAADDPAGGKETPGSEAGDSDLDWLPDAWEIAGEAPNGLQIPECDPQHRDLYIDIVSFGGAATPGEHHLTNIRETFADMPVMNPDGTEGINVHIHGPRRVDLTMDELRELEGNDRPKIGPVHSRVLYTPEFMDKRVGIYHLLGILPDHAYIRGKGGFAIHKVAMVKRMDWKMMMHQLLHTIVGDAFDGDCFDDRHSCGGFLTRPPGLYVADETVEWLQDNQYHHVGYNFTA